MKKSGLGSIPKCLSWIDQTESEVHAVPVNQEHAPVIEKEVILFSEPAIKPSSTKKGLAEGWTRATFIVDRKMNEKIKALAYWERLTVKEVIHEALTQYLQNKNVKPIPKKKFTDTSETSI